MDRAVTKEPFWAMRVDETLSILETQPAGLSEEEAASRRAEFGPNAVEVGRGFKPIALLLSQFGSPLIVILIFAGAVTVFLGEWIETGVIFAAVAINTALGFWQEYKAESALASLRSYIRIRARVRRGNEEREIDAEDLVPGDIIRISRGDRVPADARLLFVNNLEADEAVLTGESLPVAKNAAELRAGTALAERASMVYGGTLALEGMADAAITATGRDTEFGRIAELIASGERAPTPLERAISRFAARIGAAVGVFTVLLFGLGLYFGYGVFEMFLIAVAVAVAAVPEGLPVALTVILAVGVQRLAGRRAIVRRLLAAETLGSATLVLTDKTGTLTQARMEMVEAVPYGVRDSDGIRRLLGCALLNTDVVIENPAAPAEEWKMFGRAMETALVSGAAKYGVRVTEIRRDAEIVDQLPFDSSRKFSVTVSRRAGGFEMVMVGAPDVILPFTDLGLDARRATEDEVGRRALGGERVLGAASKRSATHEKVHRGSAFRDFRFLGLLAFRDPLRPGIGSMIRRILRAGVRTVIVTGDHRGTAEAVARSLGLVDGKGAVLTGDDLELLRPEELTSRSKDVSVYARVTPEQKVKIVQLYQSQGEVVAMTGDGVNDAPALERADIGVALGSGSEVAKSAADLVILDDSFETIVAAIEEGRKILDNIRKVIVYFLSNIMDELFLIGGALALGLALPLNALQILFVNFFSDSFPAVALAFEEGIDGLGSRPRKLDRNLFDRTVRFLIVVIEASTSILLFFLYYLLLRWGFAPHLVRTFIFASFATYTLFLSFSVRSLEQSILTYNPFSNLYLVAGALIGLFFTALVVYLPPLARIFGVIALPLPWIAAVVGIGVLNILAVELGKWILRRGTT